MSDTVEAEGPVSGTDDSPWRAIGVAVGLGLLGPVVAAVLSFLWVGVLSAVQLPFLVALAGLLILAQYVAFGGVALGYLYRRTPDWGWIRSYLGVRFPSLKEIGVVLGGYVLLFGILIAVSLVVQAIGAEAAPNQTAEAASETPQIVPPLIVAMFLVVGPSEELLYRGAVQGRLREAFSAAPAILITSALFAAVHVTALSGGLSARVTTIAILFFPSLVFGAVYEYTENLVVPALLHGLHNSVLMALIYVAATSGAGEAVLLGL
ncbi:lysostaphin resistance A-like protein [Halobacteriales archaeon Cl-PHB]